MVVRQKSAVEGDQVEAEGIGLNCVLVSGTAAEVDLEVAGEGLETQVMTGTSLTTLLRVSLIVSYNYWVDISLKATVKERRNGTRLAFSECQPVFPKSQSGCE